MFLLSPAGSQVMLGEFTGTQQDPWTQLLQFWRVDL